MMRTVFPAAVVGILALAASAVAQQISGVAGSSPPEDLWLEVATGRNGEPILSTDEFALAVGGYYRFIFVCPDTAGYRFEAADLLAISDQAPRTITCDDVVTAQFSFRPMQAGVYGLYVKDHADPPHEAFGRFVVE